MLASLISTLCDGGPDRERNVSGAEGVNQLDKLQPCTPKITCMHHARYMHVLFLDVNVNADVDLGFATFTHPNRRSTLQSMASHFSHLIAVF